MKIEIPEEQFKAILAESPTFRSMMFGMVNKAQEFIYQNYNKAALDEWRTKIRKTFPLWNTTQKIPAIKWIRDMTKNGAVLEIFKQEGYDHYEPTSNVDMILTLAASKRFVESC